MITCALGFVSSSQSALPQYVQHLQPVAVGNEDHEPRTVHGQVHWVICQLPLQHTLLPTVVPNPAYVTSPSVNSALLVNQSCSRSVSQMYCVDVLWMSKHRLVEAEHEVLQCLISVWHKLVALECVLCNAAACLIPSYQACWWTEA